MLLLARSSSLPLPFDELKEKDSASKDNAAAGNRKKTQENAEKSEDFLKMQKNRD